MAILYACWIKIKQHPVAALSALGALLAIPIVIALFIFTIITGGTSDDGSGGNCSTDDTEDYTANFKITTWGPTAGKHSNASKAIEAWAASQHLNAAQTAGVLGNAMAESGVGTNGSGGGKYGDFLGAGATTADTSHNGDSASAYMNWFVNTFSNTGKSTGGHNNGAWNKYKSMKGSSPYTLGYFWGAHLDAAAAGNYSQRGHWAEQAYKAISGGNSNITTADDTASSGSGSKCGQSSDDDSSTDSSVLKAAFYFKKKFPNARYGGSQVDEFLKNGTGVCTTFVSACLLKAHYGELKSLYCPTIIDHIHPGQRYGNLEGIKASQARQGDIICEYGHIMILASSRFYGKYSPKTQIIDERSNSDGKGGIFGPEKMTTGDLSDLKNTDYFARPIK